MNAGAALATGDVLLFLHADCSLEDGALGAAERCLHRRDIAGGCFTMRVRASGRLYRLIDDCATARFRLTGIAYGDQVALKVASVERGEATILYYGQILQATGEDWSGVALRLTQIIRDVGRDVRRGHVYLPLDELERFGLQDDDILQRRQDDRFEQVMAFQIVRAREYHERDHLAADLRNAACRGPDGRGSYSMNRGH